MHSKPLPVVFYIICEANSDHRGVATVLRMTVTSKVKSMGLGLPVLDLKVAA